MQLSIIVPVYNVEQFIRPCIESIYKQGLNEGTFEVILVNDGTNDNSFEIIEDIIAKYTNITVIEQRNLGLSVARNTGLSHATGDYILFLDSDDLLVSHSLPSILSHSSHTPDLIVAGFMKKDNEEINNGIDIIVDDKVEEKSGEKMFLEDLNPQQCYVWRTIYKKSFLDKNQLRFIPGIFFEDVPFTTECYLKAVKCIKTSTIFYIYRQRANSIVSSVSLNKIFDLNTVIARLWEMKQKYGLSVEQRSKLMDIIFVTFSISMWYVTHNKCLIEKRKEVIKDLKVKVPDLYFSNGMKQKLVYILYKLAPSIYIKIRSLSH